MLQKVAIFCFVALVASGVSLALADEDLAKASQNPIGNMISVPMQNNTYFSVGPSDEWANSFQLQPVYPINFGSVNLINRMIIPFNHLEDQDTTRSVSGQLKTEEVTFEANGATGLGNITYQGFISPAKPGKLIWGAGPVLQMPTNTNDRLGTDKWSAGPGAVVLAMPGKWLFGFLGYNLWSFAGDSDDANVNTLIFQYFINYNLKNGWYLTSTPIITANWREDSDARWTVPVGLGVGRLVKFGKQPVDFKIQPFWYVEKPVNGPDWSLQLQVKLLFPK